MDEIIKNLPRKAKYQIENNFFHAVCYAGDAALIADSEDNFQRLLHSFNTKAK